MTTSFAEKLMITIPGGSQYSQAFQVENADKAVLFTPPALTGTVSLQLSIDKGLTWVTYSLVINPASIVTSDDLAPLVGAFNPQVLFRLKSSVNEAADRNFTFSLVK